MANLSSQDVRAKILKLRDALILNLEFIEQTVMEDYNRLRAYKERFGDLNYRPVTGEDAHGKPTYGPPTEVVLEPYASKYRATIKSLLDSIRVIEGEILPEDNPEGEATESSEKTMVQLENKRMQLRNSFESAIQSQTTPVPTAPIEEPSPIPAKPQTTLKSKPTRGTWRDETPKAQARLIPKVSPVEKEPEEDVVSKKPIVSDEEKPIRTGLSPELRARMMGANRESPLARLKRKYDAHEDDGNEDEG